MTKEEWKSKTNSIGKEKAVELFNSNWWVGKTHKEIAVFQMFTPELCCPFDVFHEAVEKSLNRPVFTHEFGINPHGIASELMEGKPAPTFDEILSLIPSIKRVLVAV